MSSTRLGSASNNLYYLRARFESGTYDAAPRLDCIVLNGVPLMQAAGLHSHTWTILPSASITGTPPALGAPASFDFQLDEINQITALHFRTEGAPGFHAPRLPCSERSPGREADRRCRELWMPAMADRIKSVRSNLRLYHKAGSGCGVGKRANGSAGSLRPISGTPNRLIHTSFWIWVVIKFTLETVSEDAACRRMPAYLPPTVPPRQKTGICRKM